MVATGGSDREAFLDLYERTLGPVYRYLRRGCAGQPGVAEELAQETYLAALAAVRAGRAGEVGLPWLLGVAHHKLVDHYRASRREERSRVALAARPPGPAAAHGGGAAELLGALPAAQRAALALRYVDDLPVPEVARRLGRSVHATESLLARGRAALRARRRP